MDEAIASDEIGLVFCQPHIGMLSKAKQANPLI